MKFLLVLLALILTNGHEAWAWTHGFSGVNRNVACSGDITAALTTAIGDSSDGDHVSIGAGSCSMSSWVSFTDLNIVIRGAGKGVTNIAADQFLRIFANGTRTPAFRISGISLSSSATSTQAVIQVWATGTNTFRGPFRIDHMGFSYPNYGSDGLIQMWGPGYGLIDHNDFSMDHEASILTSLEQDTENCSFNVGGTCTIFTLQGNAGLTIPFDPGGTKNLYIEDNTFINANGGTTFFAAIDTAYGGGRIAFRHNTLTNVILYAHWTGCCSVNTLWWEIYNNSFAWTQGDIGLYPMRMQGGGTGLIHDNTITGFTSANYILIGDERLTDRSLSGSPNNYCDGNQSVDGNAGDASAPGWPCLAQNGRNVGKSMAQITSGDKQGTFPLYLWNNGTQAKCSNPAAGGAACSNTFSVSGSSTLAASYMKATAHSTGGYGNGDVDYSISASQPSGAGNHTLVYTPYIYPHPLTLIP